MQMLMKLFFHSLGYCGQQTDFLLFGNNGAKGMRVRGSLTSFPSINSGQASKDQNQDREVRETIICSLLFCLDTHQTATNLLLMHSRVEIEQVGSERECSSTKSGHTLF